MKKLSKLFGVNNSYHFQSSCEDRRELLVKGSCTEVLFSDQWSSVYLRMKHPCWCNNHNMILIYLSTAIGLTPGGSGTVHTHKQYIEQHK